ncbi:uncharacterized protein TNCT_718081 [Trichonephila clavata]|uniref:Integrase catalytic domain-containing protein n=1 Tax=Trichonephila clavata TaxID=2740835 RepID=A0A8X6GHY6_TRICU|nr:uncharacterized protein TNCT_718081 [Trichonephila clavata]
MSTECFLLALRRFLALRGNCKVIYSDNARTFKAAEKELAYFANILKNSEFQNFVADKGIHWKFIVERAPWWGGFYERLVKTIKDILLKILGNALLTFEKLSTILSEIEVIVNHRPLMYVENDLGEPEPLTLAHYLELGYGDFKYPIHFIQLVDSTTATGVFSEAVKCLQCRATGLNLSCEENCSGGAVELDILCDFCSYSYKFCSSKQCKAEIGKPSTYEINTRILIDSASQGSFVRESCVNLLQLKRTSVNINVDGLSSRNVGRVSGLVQLEITSLFYKNTSITVDALILPKITCDLPQFQVDASALNTFKNLQLADINCLQPSSIDILLGADVFGEIMLNRHLNVPGHSLTAMETIFGWVVLGQTKISCQRIISNHASYNAVEFQLDKFWQLEELSETKPFTNEEIACENHFKRTYTRDSTGRFAVKFPFRDSSDELGSSRDITVHRLQQIERRFSKNQSLSDQYHKFMDDYLKLGHMELIPENEIDVPASSSFYLPHHPVPNKNGDKFRVVFDESAKSSSGISLNDKLMVGPQLQTDLTTLLLRFRMHKIAITADIEKMYRQITLHDSDFQRIVWRNSPFEPIQDFRLTRVAYGTASAPYLAIKCLQQLALNESNNFPLASKAALKDFYVDDLMSGTNSLSEALELQNQLTQMVSSAGLVLRKWASNCSELLNSIDSDMCLSNTSLNIDNDDTVKTLGIMWHPASDVFYFKITPLSFEGTLTKRTLLSTIAKTFDPLGWLSPITIQYKTIMQRLWKQQLKWDERVPTDIKLEWEQLANDVQFVKDIKIPRFLLVDSDNLFHLFGFSDASERAYAAAIYCRSVSDTGKINVLLIIAKTRVAPLKTVSLPRLELCGALLLVKLMDFTCKALNYPISQAQFYTDSTIVLSWIGSYPSRWKTFVANRVAKIQTLSSATQWHHISGSANFADLATRGVSSSTLLTSIWLCGPKFLHETFPFQTDSSVPTLNDAVPEERYCTLQSIIVSNHLPDGFYHNTLSRLLLKPGSPLHPGAQIALNTENQHSKDPRRTSNMDFLPADLFQDPRVTTDYADPCKMHLIMEQFITKALAYRTYYQTTLDNAQKNPRPGNPPTYDKDLIIQRQKDVAAVNILMERLKGELASSYPCPNTDCYAHYKIPDRTHLEDGIFIWLHTDTTHKMNNPPTTNNLRKKKTDKEGFTSPNKTKKIKLTDHPNVRTENPIPLSNKFDALAPMDTDPPINTQQQTPIKKIPLIMLKYESTYSTLTAYLLSKYPDLTLKLAGDFLKIFTTNSDLYREVTNYLTDKGQQYYDFPR